MAKQLQLASFGFLKKREPVVDGNVYRTLRVEIVWH